MAPTFLPFLALLLYMAIVVVSLVIFVPMLLIQSKRLLAKKVLITVLISLPCLIVVGILFAIIFFLPALFVSWLTDNNYISQTPGTILIVSVLLLLLILVASCSLYLWYFLSQVIYKQLEMKPVSEFLQKNKLFRFLQSYLKFKVSFFEKNAILKIALVLIGIPVTAIIGVCIYEEVTSLTFAKPTQSDLVGKYHISKATVRNFSASAFNKYKLEFKRDSTFELTPTPNIDVCDSGKYEVDYQFEYNEISFRCNNTVTPAHIDRHFGYYRIEFIVGDPDSGESIYFEKDK